MSKIAKNLTELIGNTPLLELTSFSNHEALDTPLLAKVEYFNPAGSVKDRVGLAMIEVAEQDGKLCQGATIIEPTSGNTGVGLALAATIKGYKIILTMPETMSIERRNLLKAYGAQIVLTPGTEGMSGAIAEAESLQDQIPNSVILGQFDNCANPDVHFRTTGPEIWRDSDGKVDVFVAGVGTGGTISGVGRYLKQMNPDIQIVAVEPLESPVIGGGKASPHKIQGIGAGFIPVNYDSEVVDEVIAVSSDDAIRYSRLAAKTEGLLVGISSGAALKAATIVAQRPENRGKVVVALLPDTGERYLSTVLYDFDDYPL